MTNEDHIIYQDSSTILNMGLAKRLAGPEISTYYEISGYVMGTIDWATHHISSISESQNAKYTGWTIHFNDSERVEQVYIENRILDYISGLKDYKHIKNTFCKFLKVK